MTARSRITRRSFLAGCSFAAASTLLAACGPAPSEQIASKSGSTPAANSQPASSAGAPAAAAQPTSAPAAAASPVASGSPAASGSPVAQAPAAALAAQAAPGQATAAVIQFMDWDPVEGSPYEKVINEYTRQTGRKIQIIPTPGSGPEYETKVRTMLAGGVAPDIMRLNDDYVRYYSAKKQIIDIGKHVQADIKPDDYFAGILDFPKQPDGTYTAWSLGTQPRLIFYNVDHFKEAGVPLPPTEWTDQNWKWDNFLDAAKKLTKPDQRWGALVYDDTGFEQIYPVNNGEPTGIYSKDGKQFTLANPKAVEAIQWAVDLTCKHQVQPERSLVRPGNSGNNLFAGGQISMIERVASTNSYFRRNSNGFVYDVAPIPAGVAGQFTTASLVLFAVTTTSKNPDAAWDLLKFMAGPDAGKIFTQEGAFIPVHKASASLLKPGDTPPASYPANIALFAKAADHLNFNSLTNNTEGARNIYRTQLDQVFGCSISAQDLLTKVKPDVEEVLNEEL